MSRWRDMVMNYGQIFGSDKPFNGAGSDVFSVDSDIKDKRQSDLQLKRTLEVHFRPLFQRFVYGGEKIACHDLRRVLRDPEYRDRLPADKIQELADLADFNRGKAISYAEFVNIVLNELPQEDIASLGDDDSYHGRDTGDHVCSMGGFVTTACRNTTAQEMVEDKAVGYRCLPPPVFIILLTLAQIIVYIVHNDDSGVAMEPLKGIPQGNKLMYLPDRRREVWRWVSYCLLHQGYVDLMFNVVLQLFMGIPLEIMFSSWRVALVYITGVIVGSCGHSISDHYTGLVGAAGGAYALVFANIVTMIFNLKSFNKDFTESRTRRFLCSVTLRVVVILLLVIPQSGLAVYRRWGVNDTYKIGIAAHVGGMLTGCVMSDAFLQDSQRSPMKGGAALVCLFSFLFISGLTVVLNIARDDYPPEDYS